MSRIAFVIKRKSLIFTILYSVMAFGIVLEDITSIAAWGISSLLFYFAFECYSGFQTDKYSFKDDIISIHHNFITVAFFYIFAWIAVSEVWKLLINIL